MVWLLHFNVATWNYIFGKRTRFYAKIFGSIYFIFFQFFLLNLILIALSNVMEQFINDTLHIFGFELMSIQLFQYQNYHKPSLYFILLFIKRLYSMECTSLIAYDSYGKSIKHTTVLKKWGLWRILDTTGWNLLFTNQYCISYYPYWGVNPQDVFIVHFISIAIGHLNHANLGWDYGF
jgi:hypothetical protein